MCYSLEWKSRTDERLTRITLGTTGTVIVHTLVALPNAFHQLTCIRTELLLCDWRLKYLLPAMTTGQAGVREEGTLGVHQTGQALLITERVYAGHHFSSLIELRDSS